MTFGLCDQIKKGSNEPALAALVSRGRLAKLFGLLITFEETTPNSAVGE